MPVVQEREDLRALQGLPDDGRLVLVVALVVVIVFVVVVVR
ncbi:hypothetical protein [Streptomyces niveus]|nr:hypothetical protein [Streptomyces niveus]EST21181.1 hypothetical protein M877_32400 [Streptomyces niveus NCIMB 11891]